MKRHPIILLLLLLAHVLMDLVAWRLAEQQLVGSPAQILLIVMLRTQLSLLAIYLSLGTAHWAIRLSALTTSVFVWTAAFLKYDYANLGAAHTATLFTLLVLPLVLIGALARVRGYLWGRPLEAGTGLLAARQFSLGSAFRWLTIAALLLGLARQAAFPQEYWDLWLRVSLINIFVAFGFLWAAASPGMRLLKTALAVFIAIGSAALLQDDPRQAWVAKFALQTLLMLGTAEVCRIAGWPLGKSESPKDETILARSASE